MNGDSALTVKCKGLVCVCLCVCVRDKVVCEGPVCGRVVCVCVCNKAECDRVVRDKVV